MAFDSDAADISYLCTYDLYSPDHPAATSLPYLLVFLLSVRQAEAVPKYIC